MIEIIAMNESHVAPIAALEKLCFSDPWSENSIAYDTNLRYIAAEGGDCVVLVIVDAVSRKYFTSETSWLWDIDFDLLAGAKKVILSGRYANDLAVRFSYTSLDPAKWTVEEDIAAAAAARTYCPTRAVLEGRPMMS